MMPLTIISGSLVRKLAATCIAVIGFVLLYEVSVFDLRQSNPVKVVDPTAPAAGARLEFTATAYCKGATTASGVGVRTGIAASDPSILPVGSVVNISTHDVKYNGVYTIMDTGPAVQGRTLDLYMWSCHEALRFGRRPVELRVLRFGWNPAASTPSFVDRLFRRREAARVRPEAPQPAPTDTQHEDATQQAPVPTDHTDQAVGSAGESATPAVPATPLLNTP